MKVGPKMAAIFAVIVLVSGGSFYYFFIPKVSSRSKLFNQSGIFRISSQGMVNENGTQNFNNNSMLSLFERLKSEGKPVLVSVINDAYLPFAHSWLCNTRYMGIHKQVLILVTDNETKQDLTSKWPEIYVEEIIGSKLQGSQDYSHAGYVRIMVRRTECLLELLKTGVEVFLFELDAYWLTNAIPSVQKQAGGHDIVVIPVSTRKGVISGGFLYMRPTDKTIALWEQLNRMMKKLEKKIQNLSEKDVISEADNDQMYLSGLVGKMYGGINIAHMPLDQYPDGNWYKMSGEKKSKVKPLVIQNNWVVGNKGKIERAKKFSHWFWDADTGKCDSALVKTKTT